MILQTMKYIYFSLKGINNICSTFLYHLPEFPRTFAMTNALSDVHKYTVLKDFTYCFEKLNWHLRLIKLQVQAYTCLKAKYEPYHHFSVM